MNWEITFSPRAERQFDRLDRTTQARIGRRIDALETGGQVDVKHLSGSRNRRRMRVGDWRVILEFDRRARHILVVSISRRDEAYRRR